MYARGMSTREIQGHLEEIYQVEVSPALSLQSLRVAPGSSCMRQDSLLYCGPMSLTAAADSGRVGSIRRAAFKLSRLRFWSPVFQ